MERIEFMKEHIPQAENRWKEGVPGNGLCIVAESDIAGNKLAKAAKKFLKKKKLEGIEYTNNEPNFEQVALETVDITLKNSSQPQTAKQGFGHEAKLPSDQVKQIDSIALADYILAKRWGKIKKDGFNTWTAASVRQYREANGYVWHQRSNGVIMDLIPIEIAEYFSYTNNIDFEKEATLKMPKFQPCHIALTLAFFAAIIASFVICIVLEYNVIISFFASISPVVIPIILFGLIKGVPKFLRNRVGGIITLIITFALFIIVPLIYQVLSFAVLILSMITVLRFILGFINLLPDVKPITITTRDSYGHEETTTKYVSEDFGWLDALIMENDLSSDNYKTRVDY